MLVLTINNQDSFMIGNNIEVTILRCEGNRTVVGIDAPKDIPVHRKKVYERVQREKLEILWKCL